jgi:hypothetical protein
VRGVFGADGAVMERLGRGGGSVSEWATARPEVGRRLPTRPFPQSLRRPGSSTSRRLRVKVNRRT